MIINTKEEIRGHFSHIAADYDRWKEKNRYYYTLLKEFYRAHIPAGESVLELGCATGDILASCHPRRGLGVDFSKEMIALAKRKYPRYEFRVQDVEKVEAAEKFKYVVACDLLDHLPDISGVIACAFDALAPQGRLVCTTINPLWGPVLAVAERLGLKMAEGPHSFVPLGLVKKACIGKGFRLCAQGRMIFLPKKIPLLSELLNALMPRVFFLDNLCWVQYVIAEKPANPMSRPL